MTEIIFVILEVLIFAGLYPSRGRLIFYSILYAHVSKSYLTKRFHRTKGT